MKKEKVEERERKKGRDRQRQRVCRESGEKREGESVRKGKREEENDEDHRKE